MSIRYITTNETTIQTIGEDETLIVADGASIVRASGSAVDDGGAIQRLVNNGLIASSSDTVLLANNTPAEPVYYSVQNNDGGQIYGENTGLFLQTSSFNDDTKVRVTNDGSISADQYSAIVTKFVLDVIIENTGLIFSAGRGGGYPAEGGISIQDAFTGAISNTGTISTAASASPTDDTGIAIAAAVSINGSQEFSDFSVFNDGLIEGASHALFADSDFFGLTNAGTMNGDLRIASENEVTVHNSGAINGEIAFTGGANVNLSNTGYIADDITFGNGDDTYSGVGGGQLKYGQQVDLGGGDDEYYGGEGRDRVFDGAGDDEIEGNGGKDSFRAGTGENFYDGGDGYDYISYYGFSTRVRIDLESGSTSGGGSGNAASNDTILNIEAVGGTNGGSDTLLGSSERNSLFGWGSNDKLYGRGGNDKLDGGSGNDFLDGGDGTDRLFGGTGSDEFHFDRGEDDDLVMDFENNVDVIAFDNFGYLSNATDALSYATQMGSDVFFDFGNDGTLMVFNVTTGQLFNDIAIV